MLWVQCGSALTCNHLTEKLLWSVSKERHAAHQELIQDDTHGPPIHRLSVTLTKNHLGSNVLRSPTHLWPCEHHVHVSITMSVLLQKNWWPIHLQKYSDWINIYQRQLPTCLSRNSLASFSMWPSYRLVVRLIRPILDKPKSVSLMWPMEVISRLFKDQDNRDI